MKKTLLIPLCLALIILTLCACGPKHKRGTASSASPSPSAEPTPTPITFHTPSPEPSSAPTPVSASTPKVTPSSTPALPEDPIESPGTAPSGKPSPSSSPEPTPDPTEEPTPPVVTKNPTSETVPVGGACIFIAKYENAIYAVWHFVSPDGSRDLAYNDIQNIYTELKIINGYASTMQLENIPAQLNGWKVYCHFSNDAGSTDTAMATITVQQN